MAKGQSRKTLAIALTLLTLSPYFPWGGTGTASADAASQPVPSLLITEMAPDSPNRTNDAGKVVDGYEYVEVYNNSDVPVSLKGYKLLYYASSTQAKWLLDPKNPIQPHSTMVFWVKSPNLTVSLDEFNSVYNSHVTAEGFDQVVSAGFSNTGSRRVILSTPEGIEISRAEYVGIGDAADSTSIEYFYPTDGSTLMRKLAKQTPTPGTVLPGQVPDSIAPAAPQGLKAVAGDRQIELTWNAGSSNVDHYRLYINGTLTDDIITGSSYTLNKLTNYTAYTLALAAVSANNQMSPPSAIKATPVPQIKDTVIPQAPAGLTAVPGPGNATLAWSPSTDADIMAYKVYKDGKLALTVGDDVYSAVVPALTGGTAYRFEVTALDTSNNESLKSTAVTAMVQQHEPFTQEDMGFKVEDPFAPFQKYLDISSPGAIVPGLKQGLVPQGIDFVNDKNWFVISNYRRDKRPSVLSFVDAGTGSMVKSLHLYNTDGTPYDGHAGGVAVSKKHAWVANNRFLYQANLEDIYQAGDNTNLTFTQNGIRVFNNASFATYADGNLWTGDYYYPPSYETIPIQKLVNRDGIKYGAWLAGYKLDPETDNLPAGRSTDPSKPVVPDYILSIPNKIQGASFAGDKILLSYTAENAYSTLLKYKNPMSEAPHTYVTMDGIQVPVWFLDSVNEEEEMVIPPYAEEIVVHDGKAHMVFESGASYFSPYMYYPIDRIHTIDLSAWEAYDKIKIEGLSSPMFHGDEAQLKVIHSLGERGSKDVTTESILTSSNTSVAVVSDNGTVKAVGVGETTITAELGGRTASFILQVQPKLLSITTTAPKLPVNLGSQIPIVVTALYSDGSQKDVTAQSQYTLSNPDVAEFTNGVWIARHPGRTLIQASFEGKQAEAEPVVVRAKKED